MDEIATVTYQGNEHACRPGESVLETLLRLGISIPFSCRNGSCHTCLMQAKLGTPTESSQQSLKKSLQVKGYFLPCKCIPQSDLTIDLPAHKDVFSSANIIQKKMLNDTVCRILLEPVTPLYYHAGQFININRPDGLLRSYSIASVPQHDRYLELHVKRYEDGEMSQWLIDHLRVNDSIDFQGPLGQCFYRNYMTDKNILLIATGTGLAPMQGVILDALSSNHRGEIHLYHGGSNVSEFYNQKFLLDLSERHANFYFTDCLSQAAVKEPVKQGLTDHVAFENHQNLTDWVVFSAGNSEMVYRNLKIAMQRGASIDTVFGDPFERGEKPLADNDVNLSAKIARNFRAAKERTPSKLAANPGYPSPDPEMWQALHNGELLSKILDEFYSHVYSDDKLKGFFENFTKQRAIEKQYSFLRKIFTGDDVYFGDKPRNAHHWMVISEELFDYREKLMEDCLRQFSLAEHLIVRWLNMEERYRCVIVKSKAWPKVVNGRVFPLEGFDEMTMDVGSLCDSCGNEIASGDVVTYHVRLGTVYCTTCRSSENLAPAKP